MAEPTPRPWTIRPGASTHIVSGYIEYPGGGHTYETVVRQDSDMRGADAELIVRAVNELDKSDYKVEQIRKYALSLERQRDELAEALRGIAAAVLWEISNGDVPGPYNNVFEAVMRQAAAAAQLADAALKKVR